MTIPVSTAPAAAAYLLTEITTAVATDPATILVKLGEPGRNRPDDMILIGEVQRNVKEQSFVGSGGAGWLGEEYEQHITIGSWQANGDVYNESTQALQVNARAWQLIAYVEAVVRADPSLGGLVEVAYPMQTTSSGPTWTTDPVGLLVSVNLPIRIEATI